MAHIPFISLPLHKITTMLKKLPSGESSFPSIREGDWLYVDKTEEIHRLVSTGKYFFLSRPRRFGKSLTVSTLKAVICSRGYGLTNTEVGIGAKQTQSYRCLSMGWII